MSLAAARALVEQHGLLLLQDAALPSLATRVAGGPVRGSWWSSPAGKDIFAIAGALDDDPDVATMKVVDGKVTFVHRRLWPAVIAIGRARAPWQIDGLADDARALLQRIEGESCMRASGKPAKALELRWLVATAQVHTDSGAHALELRTWDRFASDRVVSGPWPPVADAQALLERTVDALPGAARRRARLPWQGRARP